MKRVALRAPAGLGGAPPHSRGASRRTSRPASPLPRPSKARGHRRGGRTSRAPSRSCARARRSPSRWKPWASSPPTALAAIRAFERSGRLPRALERVATAIEADLALLGDLAKRAAYPLFLLHAIPFALAAPNLVRGGFATALLQNAAPLLIAWLGLLAIAWWLGARAGAEARFVLAMPGVGPWVRARSMQIYFDGVAALYGAGVPIAAAHAELRALLPHRALAEMLAHAEPALDAGRSYRESLALCGALRPLELDHLETAERTGRLESALESLAQLARQDAELRARAGVRVLAGAMYLGAALAVAWSVFSFYAEIYGELRRELR